MKIVIIGLGTIGTTMLKTLSGEAHTITIIDERKDHIEQLIEKYDVQGIVGEGGTEPVAVDARLVPCSSRIGYLQRAECPEIDIKFIGMPVRTVGPVVDEQIARPVVIGDP